MSISGAILGGGSGWSEGWWGRCDYDRVPLVVWILRCLQAAGRTWSMARGLPARPLAQQVRERLGTWSVGASLVISR